MNQHLRFLAGLLLLIGLPLWAQTGATGIVSGRITDAQTRLALSGARVRVTGSSVEAYSGDAGTFILYSAPAGPQTLTIGYVGYPEVTQAVDVMGGRTTTVDLPLGVAAVKMDAFVIEGSLVGQARAINQQRAAETLSNFVAADELGRFPDQNAAESMQRIPGLALYRDQGEGRYIVVRGIRPDLNSVKIDGISMASPERGDRVVALDVIPTDALGAVEVTKASASMFASGRRSRRSDPSSPAGKRSPARGSSTAASPIASARRNGPTN